MGLSGGESFEYGQKFAVEKEEEEKEEEEEKVKIKERRSQLRPKNSSKNKLPILWKDLIRRFDKMIKLFGH